MKNKLLTALALSAFASVASAQVTLTDFGATDPMPGANDISNFFNIVIYQNDDGLNYYFDNGTPPGQTFITGANALGYTLTSLKIKTAGSGGNLPASQGYTLYIYEVSLDGTTATLLQTYNANASFTEKHWLQWSGLSVPMAANTQYAYAFHRDSSGWENMANCTGNPYAGGQICLIPTAGGTITYGTNGVSDATFDAGLAVGTVAGGTVTLTDIGTTTPTPGADDVSQLLPVPTSFPSQFDDGLNYYFDNSTPPGQTFLTGTNPAGYVMTNLWIKTAGGGGGGQTADQGYHLFIYSVSGTTATLVNTFTANSSFTENNWFQWSGLNMHLNANTKYAYTFHRDSFGWEHMKNYDGNNYTNGEICVIPQAGGTIAYGNTHVSDAAFDVGLSIAQTPIPTTPTCNANVANIYAGSTVALHEDASGTGPLYYQWITDNGTGGSLTPVGVGGTTSTNLAVNTTAFTVGNNYNYAVIVTNSFGAATSSVVTLTIVAASAPFIVTDTTASPNTTTNFVGQSQSFTADIGGTLPIAYQWRVSPNPDGSSAVNVSNATNTTLVLNNLQLTNSGYYSVHAANSVSPFTINSAWTQLTVVPLSDQFIHWQTPVPFGSLTAGQILTNPPGAYFEAEFFGNAVGPILVTVGGNTFTFTGDGSSASVAGNVGLTSGAYLGTTGDPNFNTVLNQFAYDNNVGTTHTITLHNLLVGTNYSVQVFALDDRGAGSGLNSNFQDANNAADVSATYGMRDDAYLIGTFTANSTDVAIQQNLLTVDAGVGKGNVNAVVVRTLTSQPINPDPATLNFKASVTGQTLNFSWAPNHQGWQLYTNAVGLTATGSWFPVPGSASVTSKSIAIDPTKANVFFQMRLP
jgi:hypothetical protein